MPKISDASVAEVKARLNVRTVAEALGVVLRNAGADTVKGCCPLHQEKSGSFHVHPQKNYFKCFGCGEGGDAIALLRKARGLTFPEAVEEGARLAGVLVRYEERRAAPGLERVPAGEVARGHLASEAEGGGVAVAEGEAAADTFRLPAGVTEQQAVRALRRQARYEAAREAERRADAAWLEAWTAEGAPRKVERWSARVEERFEGGAATEERVRALAEARAWPVHWVRWLAEEGLLRWPLAPWADFSGHERDLGEVALRVDKPGVRRVPDGGGWALECTVPVGYHQRFQAEARRMWRFVPYWPATADAEGKAKRLSSFQKELRDECAWRGLPEGEAVLPPLPFVVGASERTRLLVITEGQWDACAFAGEMGWMEGESAWPVECAVMGVRGASGVEVLLRYWGWWLERVRPQVLIMADNDAAGRRWDTPEKPEKPGMAPRPTFAQRLKRRPVMPEGRGEVQWVPRARRVEVRRVAAGMGKDFDDYRRARRPGPAAMAEWLRGMGFLGADGRWI